MLQGISYVPLLYLRMAEMRGLRELPTVSKNALLPVIKIRPWLTARSLDRAFEVAAESVGSERYGVDLDRFKYDQTDDRPAYQSFCELFDPTNGFANYYSRIGQSDRLIPVFRSTAQGEFLEIEDQIGHASQIDRGAFARVDIRTPGNFLDLAQRIIEAQLGNVVFIFDCGWREDVLSQAGLCVGLVNSLLDLTEEFEIVIAGSSFPDSFSGRGDRFDIQINERSLFSEVRRLVNRGQLFYGDWGSTREPRDPVPMKNIPRIDMANALVWPSWRSVEGETYEEVAERVIADPLWDDDPDLWGEYLIESTALGQDPSIKSPTTAAAVRINLHLSFQANFENPDALDLDDEPVGDDL